MGGVVKKIGVVINNWGVWSWLNWQLINGVVKVNFYNFLIFFLNEIIFLKLTCAVSSV